MKLRKWILKIHLYGGLLCFWYILIIAISSLMFQHHFEFLDNTKTTDKIVEKELYVQVTENLSESAIRIQNELNIAGWYIPWASYIDSSGILHTKIQNPKKHYLIDYNASLSRVRVVIKDQGIGSLIHALHGFSGKLPNAPLLIIWKLFTYLCLFIVIFSVFSGIWLWYISTIERTSGLYIVSGIFVLSFFLMLFIYLNG